MVLKEFFFAFFFAKFLPVGIIYIAVFAHAAAALIPLFFRKILTELAHFPETTEKTSAGRIKRIVLFTGKFFSFSNNIFNREAIFFHKHFLGS